jgi:2-keto-4-pentenoate hydratase/2-oxohepta-3-ene-1,7-dioic acid hydratase in catechol pathway
MKLATFEVREQARTGAVTPDGALLDLSAAATEQHAPMFSTMMSIIENEAEALSVAGDMLAANRGDHLYAVDEVRFLAPLPVPNSIRDFANFEKHCLQALDGSMRMRAASEPDPEAAYASYKASGAYDLPPIWYERPFYFKGNRMTCSGHGSTIRWPRFTSTMDYEVECAAIIGTGGVDIGVEEARTHIFGYTIYNDFSARDEQNRDQRFRMGPSKGKDFDTGNAFGPWIVTRDELSNPASLRMESRINGAVQGQGRLGDMQHSFEQCIAFVSRDETLYPGDIFGSGTMGNGCGYETGRYLDPGDVIEIEIEGIGTLTNIIGEKRT